MLTLKEWLAATDKQKNSLIMAYSHQARLREHEAVYMQNNSDLLDRFFIEAHEAAKTTNHYSAEMIINVLRYHSRVKDTSQREFKIANAMKAPLARISMAMFPALNGLFKTLKRDDF